MSDDAVEVRVRGIYTTAVTRLFLDAGHDVVQASEPIRDRFDADFGDGAHEVAVETTGDRQGVGVHGDPPAVETAAALLWDVGVDAFAWTDAAPPGAVFDARVTDTLGSGALCALGGGTEGFLPFDATDDRIEEGDAVRVQVRDSKPPWRDRRPRLGTDVRTDGGLATLVRGGEGVAVDTRDDAAGRELVGMTDLLGVEPPEGWGLRWSHAATRADMDALRDSLERAAARADELDAALGDAGGVEPARTLAAPRAGRWVWFGRASRFALDDHRRAVSTTMPGHHRTKAASESASAGVDFAEALCDPGGGEEFPFGVVTRQFGPTEGDRVAIGHGKPDGRRIVLGRGDVVEWDADGTLSVKRELSGGGTYDALGVARESGDTALTKFREGRWWYPTVYRNAEGAVKGTYVNVCTPVECFPDEVRYVDLHVDVIKHTDGTVERVDDDELDDAVAAGHVSEPLAEKARSVAASLVNALGD
jgi:Ribonuclease G/E